MLHISPLDGRYKKKVSELKEYFSEFALIRYRLLVEIEYLIALLDFLGKPLSEKEKRILRGLCENFSEKDAKRVKQIEQKTNHDLKAVEYFIKERLPDNVKQYEEMVHFGLTSCDINDNAHSLMLKNSMNDVYLPLLEKVIAKLRELAKEHRSLPMLARTHGQPASPTTVGKEFANFAARLQNRVQRLKEIQLPGKLTGATGNFNALQVAYPEKDWINFSTNFIKNLGLKPKLLTTQIASREEVADLLHTIITVNNILLDLNRDMWLYISYDYFKLKVKEGEVGSSTMPHKVNPINFENSEGNLDVSNALLLMLASKIQISRLQRDLSDSTVTRNYGIAIGHSVLGMKSCLRGLDKIYPNTEKLQKDLKDHPEVLAEAIQTILRREGVVGGYEKLKSITRGQMVELKDMHAFIRGLRVSEKVRKELMGITTENYTGLADKLVDY